MASTLMPTNTFHQIRNQQIAPPLWALSSNRFQTALLISTACVVFGLMRTCMGMAMVDIVRSNTTSNARLHMDWSADQQAHIHTAFYVGAFLAVFPSEYLTTKLGPKNLMSFGLILNIIGSAITPFLAIYTRCYLTIVVVRFVMGFGYGFLIPAGSVLISKWFPISEKSTAMAIFTTGNQIGIAAAMFLTAKLCQLDGLFEGWPVVFELYALIALVFVGVWHWRIADKPAASKCITATELMYIRGGKARRTRAETVVRPTPYLKILLNGCVCAICACSFAQSFVLVALVTYLPKYNQIAMRMNLSNNGVWSAIPFLIQMLTKLMFAVIADRVKQLDVDVTRVTKIANGIASFLTALFIVIGATLPLENTQLIQVCITISMALFSAYVPGYNTSIVTVAPQFTAFISSYAQFYAQSASALAPIVIGNMTRNNTTWEWRVAFYTLAAVLVATGLVFQIFGHGRTEPWGETPSNATSMRLSSCIVTSEDSGGGGTCRMTLIEKHNHDLRRTPSNESAGTAKKKVSRVSYGGEEIILPSSRIEDLENDVIYCIEEEE